MNAYRLRSMFSHQNTVPFTFLFLLVVIVICGLTAGTGLSSAKEVATGSTAQLPKSASDATSEDIEKEFNDDDLKMKGEKPLALSGGGRRPPPILNFLTLTKRLRAGFHRSPR